MSTVLAFGSYRYDRARGELRKHGVRIKLQPKPQQVLDELLKRPGQVVTRAELHKRLWPENTFVDFDQGLNVAIKKLRDALGDSAEESKFIVTAPGVGYRFAAQAKEHAKETVPADAKPADSALETRTGNVLVKDETRAHSIAQPASSNFRKWAPLAAVFASAAVVALLWLSVTQHGKAAAAEPVRAEIQLPPGLRLMSAGVSSGMALSPDGKTVVFSALGDDGHTAMWIRRLDSSMPERLAGTEDSNYPFWSPDGKHIGFITAFQINQVNLQDGSVAKLTDADSARGASWSADGKILFASSTRAAIHMLDLRSGGRPIRVTELNAGQYTTHRWPVWLPDGKHFVFLAANHDSASKPGALYLASLGDSRPRFLAEADSNAVVVGETLLFVSHGKLIRQRINLDRGELEAEASIIAEGIGYDPRTWYGNFSAVSDVLLYVPRPQQNSAAPLVWFDRTGKRLKQIGQPIPYQSVELGPTGDVAALCGDPDTNVCLARADGTTTQITSNPIAGSITWSPDGSMIAYSRHSGESAGAIELVKLRPSINHSTLVTDPKIIAFAWCSDGKHLLLSREENGFEGEVLNRDLETGRTTPYLNGVDARSGGRFSPDGRWLAYVNTSNGMAAVYVASYPAASVKYRVAAGQAPRWRGDGKELYLLDATDTIQAVAVSSRQRGLKFGQPEALFRPPIVPAPWDAQSYDVSRDGQRFIVNTLAESGPSEFVVMTNWQK